MPNPNISLVGRLGQDPAPIGENGLRLRVVTHDRVKNEETGKYEDSATSWWTVKLWGKFADQARYTFKKGQEVFLTGTIHESTWVDKSGNNRSEHEIKVFKQMEGHCIGLTSYSLQKDRSSERSFDEVEVPF